MADATYVSTELIYMIVDFPLTLFLIYVIIQRIGFMRHFAQISLSVCELYGCKYMWKCFWLDLTKRYMIKPY